MSKIGKKPISIPDGVVVTIVDRTVEAVGPLGHLTLSIPEDIKLLQDNGLLTVTQVGETKHAKSMHGTYTRLLSNLINGVKTGFEKSLEIVGTGFKAEIQGDVLLLSLGYSHQIKYPVPAGITVKVTEGKITVSGIDRFLVGLIARKIKSFREPDNYKGKGIRYLGQQLKLKPGKAAAKGTTK